MVKDVIVVVISMLILLQFGVVSLSPSTLALGSVLLVSIVSLVGSWSLFVQRDIGKGAILLFVSFSTGALLGDVFLHLVPEMAERMILELKDKMGRIESETALRGVPSEAPVERIKEDALSALVNLGYKGAAVKEIVERILKGTVPAPSLDQLLKQALRVLAG